MKFFLPAIFLPAFFLFANVATAQNVFRDYVVDKHAQYSPTDQTERGLIYRIQTGHAGFFANCDDEPEKLYSPYIQWPCRNDLHYNRLADLKKGCHRRMQRFIDGAGYCITGLGDCFTGDCSGCRTKNCSRCCNSHALQLTEEAGSAPAIDELEEETSERPVARIIQEQTLPERIEIPKSAKTGKMTDFPRR